MRSNVKVPLEVQEEVVFQIVRSLPSLRHTRALRRFIAECYQKHFGAALSWSSLTRGIARAEAQQVKLSDKQRYVAAYTKLHPETSYERLAVLVRVHFGESLRRDYIIEAQSMASTLIETGALRIINEVESSMVWNRQPSLLEQEEERDGQESRKAPGTDKPPGAD